MARASTFTESVAGVIVRAVEAGLTLTAAAGVAGVPRRTLNKWLSEGKRLCEADDESAAPLAVFARQVEAARAFAACNVVNDASRTDWKAAAYMLDRLDPVPPSRSKVLDRLERRVNELACKMGVDLAAVGV